MSKERLEEINNFSSLPLKKTHFFNKRIDKKELKANDYHMPKNININTQYLLEIIEQSERVQELEVWYHSYHKEAKLNNILKIQNKRYREAVEEAIKDLENECLWDALIKLKALEGEAGD